MTTDTQNSEDKLPETEKIGTESVGSDKKFVEIGELFFKYRDYTPIPLIILMIMFAKPSVGSATFGMLLIVFGELFRIYSVAFIGTVSRTRSSSTGQALITSGPFAYVRNPLYVGNFLIVLGIALFAHVLWLGILTIGLFAVQYFFVVNYEENILAGKFGEEYNEYRKKVHPWIPKKYPKLDEIEWPDNFSPSLKSEKRTLTAILIMILLLI